MMLLSPVQESYIDNYVREIISSLPPKAIQELLSGYENDLDRLLSVMREQTCIVTHMDRTLDMEKLEYLANVDYVGYGVDEATEYRAVRVGDSGIVGQRVKITTASGAEFDITTNYSGRQGATIVLAAASVADMLGVATEVIAGAIAKLEPFAGRLQVLDGVNDSQIIDDTYNSSPLATRAALDVLYAADVPQKIAILGDMNELGETSADEHRTLGEYCRADKLDYVVTIGVQSREYLAPAAREAGCQVKSFTDPVRAGEFVRDVLQPGAIILAKGSQNGVFAEEAVKQLLRNPSDAGKLVRQSEEWMGKKRFN